MRRIFVWSLLAACGSGQNPDDMAGSVPDLGGVDLSEADATPTHVLAVKVANVGAAGGSVHIKDNGALPPIDCSSDCTQRFDPRADAILDASPAPGFYFGGWSGDCSGLVSGCSVKMSADRQ